jgi:hypothetical protein
MKRIFLLGFHNLLDDNQLCRIDKIHFKGVLVGRQVFNLPGFSANWKFAATFS